MNLWDTFDSILKDYNNWNPNPRPKVESDVEYDIDNLFVYPNSYNYVFELFFRDNDFRSLSFVINKIYLKHSKEVNRLNHTISLYLLGIMIASSIGFHAFSLNQWDVNSKRNFLHYWLAICLFHDIGYAIENNKTKYNPDEIPTLDDFVSKFKLQYNLKTVYNQNTLSNYYFYRINECKLIDHGIAGAMLMYDSLMKREAKNTEIAKTAIIISEKPVCGDSLKNDFAECAYVIAKHNMWFATSSREKTLYSKYELSELISCKNKINFNNSPMLFLLCLLDTIEPLKIYSGNAVDILKKIEIECNSQEREIIISDHYAGSLPNKVDGLQKWMQVTTDNQGNNTTIIKF